MDLLQSPLTRKLLPFSDKMSRLLPVFSGLIFLLLLIPVKAESQIIPSSRRIEWNPGIPGGIPSVQSPVENIVDHGADPGGENASGDALSEAIDALPEGGGVIYFPEGKYRFTSGIDINRSNIVLRGAGPEKTKLLFDTGGDCIAVETYQRGDWQTLLEGYKKGSKTVIVDDGSQFTVGEFAEIRQDNDPDIMYTEPDWNVSWGEHSVGQLFEVESIKGDTLTFKTPLHISFRSYLYPQIRPQGFLQYVGIEDLYIEKLKSHDSNTILFKNTAYCWVKNIESYHTYRTHLHMRSSLGCEVRHSYFHHAFDYGGGGHGYGVECNRHSSDILVEDNIFDSLRHAMIIQVGANGNVYGYNYSVNPVQGTGETNLNDGWVPPDISVHGHYPFMNLFEGNYVNEVGIADYWGPVGPGNTYFRNTVAGEGMFYYDHSHKQNVIGNITTVLRDRDGNSEEKLEHGNVVGGQTQWHDTIQTRVLPNSYYHNEKPEFFGNIDWPVYGPNIQKPLKLPAQYRYEKMKKKERGFFLNKWQPLSISSPAYEEVTPPSDSASSVVYVDPHDTRSRISPFSMGQDLNLFWGKYYHIPELRKDIANLNPRILRYPAGNGANKFFWNRGESDGIPPDADVSSALYGQSDDPEYLSIDHEYILRDTVGATGMNTVNYAYARYGTGEDPVAKAAHHAAEWVRYDNGRTQYWEIGNENYGKWTEGYEINTSLNNDGQPQTINGELYGKHFKVFVDSMKKAAREIGVEIYIGAVAYHSSGGYTSVIDNWNEKVFAEVGDVADFIIVHRYFGNWEDADASTILETAPKISEPKEVVTQQLKEQGFSPLPVALTEWNIRYEGRKQNVSCASGLHASLASANIIESGYGQASRWNMVWNYNKGESHGLFATNDDNEEEGVGPWSPRAPFFYMYYFNRFLGDHSIRSVVQGNENVKAFASTFSSGQTSLALSNIADSAETVKVSLFNFNPGKRYYYYTLTGDSTIMSRKVSINGDTTTQEGGGPDDYAQIKAKSALAGEEIKLELPPYSATYVLVEGTDSIKQSSVKFQLYARNESGTVKPAEKARVEFDNLAWYTGQDGSTSFRYLPGKYSYTISKPGFAPQSGKINLAGDTLLIDTLEQASYKVDFHITEADGQQGIYSCSIKLDKLESVTDTGGYASLRSVNYGYYNLEISKPHYNSLSTGPFLISSDTTLHLSLEREEYQVHFVVTDKYNGESLWGADLTIQDFTGQTDRDGSIDLSLPYGHYNYTLEKEDYDTIQNELLLTSDTTLQYAMNKVAAEVTFEIYHDRKPVNDVRIIFNEDTLFTNALGMKTFDNVPLNRSLSYKITKSGFQTIEDSLVAVYDTTVNLELTEPLIDIAFNIASGDDPVQNARIILNQEDTLWSDDKGSAVFSDLLAERTYRYNIHKDDYEEVMDSVYVSLRDTTLNIDLLPTSVEISHKETSTRIYPNPVRNKLFVESDQVCKQFTLLNMAQKPLKVGKPASASFTVDLSGLEEGLYIIRLTGTNGVQRSYKIVILK
jgi:hypothetical protein